MSGRETEAADGRLPEPVGIAGRLDLDLHDVRAGLQRRVDRLHRRGQHLGAPAGQQRPAGTRLARESRLAGGAHRRLDLRLRRLAARRGGHDRQLGAYGSAVVARHLVTSPTRRSARGCRAGGGRRGGGRRGGGGGGGAGRGRRAAGAGGGGGGGGGAAGRRRGAGAGGGGGRARGAGFSAGGWGG